MNNFQQRLNRAVEIRDAHNDSENTAERVGALMYDVISDCAESERTQDDAIGDLSARLTIEKAERVAALTAEETARNNAITNEVRAREEAIEAEQNARISDIQIVSDLVNRVTIPFDQFKYKGQAAKNNLRVGDVFSSEVLAIYEEFNSEIVKVSSGSHITINGLYGSLANKFYLVSERGFVIESGFLTTDVPYDYVPSSDGFLVVSFWRRGQLTLPKPDNTGNISTKIQYQMFDYAKLNDGYFYTSNVDENVIFKPSFVYHDADDVKCGCFYVPANTKFQVLGNTHFLSLLSLLIVSKETFKVLRNITTLTPEILGGLTFDEDTIVYISTRQRGGIAFTEGSIERVRKLDYPKWCDLKSVKGTKILGYANNSGATIGGILEPVIIHDSESRTNWFTFVLPLFNGESILFKDKYLTGSANRIYILDIYDFKIIDIIEVSTGTVADYTYSATQDCVILGPYYTSRGDALLSYDFDVEERLSLGAERFLLGAYPILHQNGIYKFESTTLIKGDQYINNMGNLQVGELAPAPNFSTNAGFSVIMLEMQSKDYIKLIGILSGSGHPYSYFLEYGTNKVLEKWNNYTNNTIEYTASCRGILVLGSLFGVKILRGYTNNTSINSAFLETKMAFENGGYWTFKEPIEKYSLTLSGDYWAKIMSGGTVKIGFLGDSTTDGMGTTGFVRSVNGHEGSEWDNTYNGGPGRFGSSDYINTNAYSYKLEQLLKKASSNNNLRVYNMGWSGKTMKWAYENREDIFGGAYSDVDIVGLVYGINDSTNTAGTVEGNTKNYRLYAEKMIEYLYKIGKRCFLVNPQSTVKYNMTSMSNESYIIDILASINKDLSQKYNLELIDMTSFDEMVVEHSVYPYNQIAIDVLHFKDLGHSFEAGFLFSNIVKRTLKLSIDEVASFVDQTLIKDDESSIIYSGINTDQVFKVESHTTDQTKDLVLGDAWFLNDTKRPMTIKAYGTSIVGAYCTVYTLGSEPSNIIINSDGETITTIGVGELVNLTLKSNKRICRFGGFKAIRNE